MVTTLQRPLIPILQLVKILHISASSWYHDRYETIQFVNGVHCGGYIKVSHYLFLIMLIKYSRRHPNTRPRRRRNPARHLYHHRFSYHFLYRQLPRQHYTIPVQDM